MRALITGACGFVGRHMLDLLIKKGGFEVTATDLHCKKQLDPKIKFDQADLTDQSSLENIFKKRPFDYVFHAAAIFDYSAPPASLRKVNVDGTKNLLSLIKKYSPRAITVLWSSGAIYGGADKIAAEESLPRPENNYELSKLEQEKAAGKFKDLKLIVIRPAAVYGPGSVYGAATTLFMIARGQIPFLIGNGKSAASLVHVSDVVGAALYLAERYNRISSEIKTGKPEIKYIFNISDDSQYTNDELFLWMEKCLRDEGRTDVKLLRFHYPIWALKPLVWLNSYWAKKSGKRPPLEADLAGYLGASRLMSNAKLKSLGYQLRYPDTKIGIKETIEHYKEAGMI